MTHTRQDDTDHAAPILWVAAGGTGGHVFPALSLAKAARAQGWCVRFFTDQRGLGYQRHAPDGCVLEYLPSAPLRPTTLWQVIRGVVRSLAMGLRDRPAVVVGFGGYPSVPPVLAAQLLGIPTIVHESNAVMGLANRVLAPCARVIAVSFPETPTGFPAKTKCTGNPVREDVADLAHSSYVPPAPNGPFHLLIVGGSLGAQRVTRGSARALRALSPDAQARLVLTQQIRTEDVPDIAPLYHGFPGHLVTAPFFDDLPQRLMDAHLVIARAGGSTLAELATAGRPSILIPYRGHSDSQQDVNARALEVRGGAIRIDEADLDGDVLADTVKTLMDAPDKLAEMAHAARTLSSAGAVQELLACVRNVSGHRWFGKNP